MAEALGAEFKSSGVTEKTPGNIPFGAGTIHKGLTFDSAGTKKNGTLQNLLLVRQVAALSLRSCRKLHR